MPGDGDGDEINRNKVLVFKGENNVTQKRRKRDTKGQVLSQFKAHQSRKGGGSTTKVNFCKLGRKRCTLLQTIHNSNIRRGKQKKRTASPSLSCLSWTNAIYIPGFGPTKRENMVPPGTRLARCTSSGRRTRVLIMTGL